MAGRLAVVTGASSGIGEATAKALGAYGWTVVLVARRADELRRVASQVDVAGGVGVPEPLDAADPEAVATMAARLRREHGIPDVIVNAAGAGAWEWPEDTPPASMETMLDAPYRAAYHVTQAFLADQIARGSGVIVHVGSPAALAPWPGATAYTVSRWALRGFHEALRQDLAGTGVSSCNVVFAEVATPYFDANEGARQRRPRLGRLVRVCDPTEAAEVILTTIARPRPQVLHPSMLRVMHAFHRLFPRVTLWAVRLGGPRRR
jgi:uncharacterized protein